jgi:type I restriction-modification system DNA methylase subunit
MSGVERDHLRVKATGEVFTPTALVQELLDQLPPTLFTDPAKTFLDNSCGDGQFLSEVLIRKLENGIDFETALGTIYGVDLMPDNVKLCQDRLLCGQEHLRSIVEKNIVCADALTYDYLFGEPETFGPNGIFEYA